ncbi:class I SAM-dependent methyltransferase [Rathayibacter iranicus]|uniref:Methyltransferase domain-containing protein n=2 Tax=Rathayibacter iranicus TaxID=59737 RepID=A0AAD1AE04_9MICO|nr:class I SAM-dependent methyltransferase [Rathayibacter iranicus]AZZ56796.1 methyltransferase domain-containing protein [Rathayibacter iranicus]MWV31979.1 methyltransferase domain-containing protein [Rathayibacter iranicus NCPPB 2253 = VKM Ac-1602]PPI42856.1 methyltransferase [Rathayibacter iranicus]PPI58120.1 methyltransferase [Rathayibacter iranicus]PPI69017.1 methyltransferase [Rathayibacter iranicus]
MRAPLVPDLRRREVSAQELMDDPDCDRALLDATYARFGTVNRLVAGWRGLYRSRVRPLLLRSDAPFRLLDIGSGGGDVARALAGWAREDGLRLSITAVDPDERASAFATSTPAPAGVEFRLASSTDLVAEGARFDLVTSNHVLHHLSPQALAALLRDSERLAPRALHNDIERSRLAYTAYLLATRPLAAGSFLHYDGSLSVRRSFTAAELRAVAPEGWRVERAVPYRLLLTRGEV